MKNFKKNDQSRIKLQEIIINKIIQEWEQYWVFTINRVIIVDEIASFIFEILFIEKINHDEKYEQIWCIDIHVSLFFFKSRYNNVLNFDVKEYY